MQKEKQKTPNPAAESKDAWLQEGAADTWGMPQGPSYSWQWNQRKTLNCLPVLKNKIMNLSKIVARPIFQPPGTAEPLFDIIQNRIISPERFSSHI